MSNHGSTLPKCDEFIELIRIRTPVHSGRDTKLNWAFNEQIPLPDDRFEIAWNAIVMDERVRNRLVAQMLSVLTIRRSIPFERAPIHGLVILSGPPGTGKTTLARGLANRIAKHLPKLKSTFLEVDPHQLASAALGKSQQQMTRLFAQTIPEAAIGGPLIVLLDELESLAADRKRMSLESNPIDVHRSTNALLAGVDFVARLKADVLFIATTNHRDVVDTALLSRADMIEEFGLPDAAARGQIISDVLNALKEAWPKIGVLDKEVPAFVLASEGLDGRQLRKSVLGALAQSIDVAQDPNLLTGSDIIASIRNTNSSANSNDHEAA